MDAIVYCPGTHDPRMTSKGEPAPGLTRKFNFSLLSISTPLYIQSSRIPILFRRLRLLPDRASPHAHTLNPQSISRHQNSYRPHFVILRSHRRLFRRYPFPIPSEREFSCHPAPVAVPLVTATLQLGPDKRFGASITPST